jgi:acetyl esterase/lipase
MASEAAPRVVVDECRGVLFVYSDGTVVRRAQPGFATPVRDDGTVDWKDVTFDEARGLALRLYLPRDRGAAAGRRLPVFFYYHGGGFCIGSRAWPNCQNYCLRLASDLGALVVAPDYRLAPEHRLPAAIDDGAAAVLWLARQGGGDPWVAEAADLGRVFVSGDSAGGTIAHHLAVRFGGSPADLAPVAVRGYVQLMPFFGGVARTRSEAECPADAFLDRPLNDRYWRLSLPEGATPDHPVANPFGPGAPPLDAVDFAPTLVVVGGRDLLHDRAVDYAARLRAAGKPVVVRDFHGQQHGFFTIDPWSDASAELMRVIKRFVDADGRFDFD